jgi:hypothetical protein
MGPDTSSCTAGPAFSSELYVLRSGCDFLNLNSASMNLMRLKGSAYCVGQSTNI